MATGLTQGRCRTFRGGTNTVTAEPSSSQPVKRAAFFDMDHTVLRIDSSLSWMRFLQRRGELSQLYALRALWWSIQYKLALLDLDTLADRLVAELRGDAEVDMITKTEQWHRLDVACNVSDAAVKTIGRHRECGDVVVLLTGSSQYAARSVAQMLDIEHVLSTELEVRDGHFTGKVAQRCFGGHKVRVAQQWASAHGVNLDDAVFYSDSYNDLPMLSRVGRPVAVNPDVRLRRHAMTNNWSIERWT